MPAAIVGVALVGSGVMAVSTLSYIALGVTVAGMVTKNKTLLKIGGQLGMAAGVAGIGQALMGAGAAAGAAGAGGAGGTAGEVAGTAAADTAAQAAPLANTAAPAADITATNLNIPATTAPPPAIKPPVEDMYSGILGGGGAEAAAPTAAAKVPGLGLGETPMFGAGQGATAGTEAGATQGATAGTTQGGAAQGDKKEGSFGKFFDFLKDDKGNYDKYIVTEGAKLIGGGIQGAYGTHVANKKLEEEQRIAAVKLANAKSASGFGNRTVVRG